MSCLPAWQRLPPLFNVAVKHICLFISPHVVNQSFTIFLRRVYLYLLLIPQLCRKVKEALNEPVEKQTHFYCFTIMAIVVLAIFARYPANTLTSDIEGSISEVQETGRRTT